MTNTSESGLFAYSKSYKPFKYPWAMQLAEKHESIHWIHQEIDFSPDVKDWHKNLNENEKNLIHQILRLFTQSDAQVGTNYADFIIPRFRNNEIRNMLYSFVAREGIHQRAYAALNETLNLPDTDFEAFLEYKEMNEKIEFWKDCDTKTLHGLGLAICKNVFAEGVSLFASFVMLLNFQRFGKMMGMCTVNKWSILDESEHCIGLIKLFRTYVEEHPRIVTEEFKEDIRNIAKTTYKLESKFIDLAYEMGEIEGLPKEDVKQYIKYIIDRRLIELGIKGVYRVKDNPLPWIDEIVSAPIFENFFETKVTDYSKGGMSGTWEEAWN